MKKREAMHPLIDEQTAQVSAALDAMGLTAEEKTIALNASVAANATLRACVGLHVSTPPQFDRVYAAAGYLVLRRIECVRELLDAGVEVPS